MSGELNEANLVLNPRLHFFAIARVPLLKQNRRKFSKMVTNIANLKLLFVAIIGDRVDNKGAVLRLISFLVVSDVSKIIL